MFESILNSNSLTILNAFICMITALILGIIIAYTHKLTDNSSKNFIITLALLPLLVEVVIMMVNGNLGTSVAIVGAFTLIRFRSMPGTSKELTSIFFSMAVGLAVGIGQIFYAICFTITTSLIIFILNKTNFGNIKNKIKELKVTIPEDLDYQQEFSDIFNKYTNKYKLFKIKTTNLGSLYELTYELNLKDNINEKELIDEIRCRNSNLNIILKEKEELRDL